LGGTQSTTARRAARKNTPRARAIPTCSRAGAPLPQSDTEKIASLEKEITNIHETLTRRAINSRNTTDVFGRAFVLPVDEEHKAKVCGSAQLCSCALPHMRGTPPPPQPSADAAPRAMLVKAGGLGSYDPQIIKPPAEMRGADQMNYDDVKPTTKAAA